MQPNENRIRECAYQIWESEGKPNDRAEEHWYKACEFLETNEHSSEAEHSEHHNNFIPHQNTKKGKHAHHSHQPLPH